VFAGLLLLGAVLKEVLILLANGQASLATVGQAIVLLVPWVLVFALPMGMMTAALLVFGRLSADQELTAIRASGISLLALVTPVLLLSLALSGVCALINLHVGPQSRRAYKTLIFGASMARAGALLPEKTFIKDFPGKIIYVGNVKGNELQDILLYKLDDDGKVEFYVRAAEGTLNLDTANRTVTVHLREAWRIGWYEERLAPLYIGELELVEQLSPEARKRKRVTEMTFSELQTELAAMEELLTRSSESPKGSREEMRTRLSEMQKRGGDLTLPLRVQMHREVSFSFACIGFTLVGIPLGIRAHRRETTFGIAMALILVVIYYSFFILGQALETRAEYFPHLIMWVPNFLFQAVGVVLLWRANRGV
jgi:lipopolysaccharide export system permease protein